MTQCSNQYEEEKELCRITSLSRLYPYLGIGESTPNSIPRLSLEQYHYILNDIILPIPLQDTIKLNQKDLINKKKASATESNEDCEMDDLSKMIEIPQSESIA